MFKHILNDCAENYLNNKSAKKNTTEILTFTICNFQFPMAKSIKQ